MVAVSGTRGEHLIEMLPELSVNDIADHGLAHAKLPGHGELPARPALRARGPNIAHLLGGELRRWG